MSQPPTAFVAGATGYTGRSVVEALRDRGVRTLAHVRPDSSRLDTWRERFEALGAEVDTTAWDEDAMTARLTEVAPAAVFALLGTTKHRMRASGAPEANTYEAVDYGLSALLLRACVASGTSPRYVYLSAMGVGPRALGSYLKVRWRLESELRASGLPWTIARPAVIGGGDREEDRAGEDVARVAGDAVLSIFGRRARAKYGSIRGAELARGLVRLGLDPSGAGVVADPADLRDRA